MPAAQRRPYLSPTQLDMYTRCPEQYRRRYIEKHIIPPGIAIIKGHVLHAAIATNFHQKKETRVDLPSREMMEIAAATFDLETAGGYSLDDGEDDFDRTVGQAKDRTVKMVEFHSKHQAPRYQPVMVEERVTITLPGTHDLQGVLDLADDQDDVTDFKTSRRRKPEAEARDSVQLTTYAAAFQAKTGRPARRIALDVVVDAASGISRQYMRTARDQQDFQKLANRINAVVKGIQAGSFPPTAPGVWWCSTKFCGYARTCPYFNAERSQ